MKIKYIGNKNHSKDLVVYPNLVVDNVYTVKNSTIDEDNITWVQLQEDNGETYYNIAFFEEVSE